MRSPATAQKAVVVNGRSYAAGSDVTVTDSRDVELLQAIGWSIRSMTTDDHVESDPVEIGSRTFDKLTKRAPNEDETAIAKFVEAYTEDRATLRKFINAVSATVTDIQNRLTKLEDTPLPVGHSTARVVEKRDESSALPAADPAEALQNPDVLRALSEAAIRAAHRGGPA